MEMEKLSQHSLHFGFRNDPKLMAPWILWERFISQQARTEYQLRHWVTQNFSEVVSIVVTKPRFQIQCLEVVLYNLNNDTELAGYDRDYLGDWNCSAGKVLRYDAASPEMLLSTFYELVDTKLHRKLTACYAYLEPFTISDLTYKVNVSSLPETLHLAYLELTTILRSVIKCHVVWDNIEAILEQLHVAARVYLCCDHSIQRRLTEILQSSKLQNAARNVIDATSSTLKIASFQPIDYARSAAELRYELHRLLDIVQFTNRVHDKLDIELLVHLHK